MTQTSRARKFGLAVAQMGPVHLADSRQAVVKRLVEMLREAAARQATFVVFPELALTTFFPRYWMTEEEAVERYFERSMPNADVQPLFDAARELGVGFYLGYAELTADGRRFNICPATTTISRTRPSSIWKRNSSKWATWASRSGTRRTSTSACASATTAAGRRRGVRCRCKAPS
jgi:predicted amidohydrolase